MTGRTLVTRLDSLGDVLLAGPAVRAVAALGPVDMLCSGIGAPAAAVLPGVDQVLRFDAPWVLRDAPDVSAAAVDGLVRRLGGRYARAAILTSSHQSSLPMALLLRLAGVPEIAAVSLDHPGRLLDHRIAGDPDVHEVERALLVVAALGAPRPAAPVLRVRAGADVPVVPDRLVVHPGAAAAARTLSPAAWRDVVALAAAEGLHVVVTGSREEERLVAHVAGRVAVAAVTSTLEEVADVLASGVVVACGNTGPMHLAAALGRPLVVPFAATVPSRRWRPWGVPHVLLGDEQVACAGCRHVVCPLPLQHCLAAVDARAVVAAVQSLTSPTREVVP